MRMIRLVVVLAMSLCVSAAFGEPSLAATRPATPQPGRQVLQHAVGFDYWLYLPKDYDQQKEVPLVIFLHGINPLNIDDAKKESPPARVDAGHDFPFVLVSPFWHGQWWNTEEVLTLVDTVAARYKIDLHRIYLTGLSMGGISSWGLAGHHPDRFAALLPIAGNGDARLARALKDVPTWSYHGALDNTVGMDGDQRMVDALKAAGGDVKFTVFKDKGHVVWDVVYSDPKTYEWLLSHRKATPAPIDRQAEVRYDVKHNLQADIAPLVTAAATVGDLSTKVELTNATKLPVQVRGTLAAGNLKVSPATFDVSLKPGEKQSVNVTVAGGQTPISGTTAVDAKWTATARPAEGPELTANFSRHLPISQVSNCSRLSKPATVDGDLSDWNLPWIEVGSVVTKATTREEKDTTSPRALMAVAWDDKAVYVAVRVKADKVQAAPTKQVWEQNAVEVRFDFRPTPRPGSFADWQDILPILVAPTNDIMKPTLWQKESLPKGTQIASKITATGFDTEIAIPLSYAAAKQDGRLRQFRLGLCVNDTEGRRGVNRTHWHPDWRDARSDDGVGTFQCVAP